MNTKKTKKNEKILIKVSKSGAFKIPTQIKKLHKVDVLELGIQKGLIVLEQLSEEQLKSEV